MADDLDVLLEQALQPPRTPCKYCDLTANLTDDQRDRLDRLDASKAASVLTAAGMRISPTPIRKHRDERHQRG